MKFVSYLFISFLIVQQISVNLSFKKLTNIICKNYTNLVSFPVCRIKAVNRSSNELYITAALSRPVNNIMMDIKLVKKANEWKTFLYDIKNVDFCRYMRTEKKKRNKIFDYLFNLFGRFSNINHTCPYEGNLIIDKLSYNEDNIIDLPMPMGDYGLFTSWKSDGIQVATVKGFLTHANYSKLW